MSRRVVVTGMGIISALGNTTDVFFKNILGGKLGIDYITRFDTTDFAVKVAAEVKDFNAELYMHKKETKKMDLYSIYALAAATCAMEQSGIDLESIDKDRFGVIVGSGIGGLGTIEEQVNKLANRGPSRVSPMFIPMAIVNMAAGNIAIKFEARGVCTSVVTACATGNNCIGEAFRSIKHGYSDVIIAGGTEACITKIGIAGFTSITALSQSNDVSRASIPFDKERNGFVMGEGAGILILEELSHAQERNAKIYAEITGYGATCDAYHMTSPNPEGLGAAKAMTNAILESGISPNEIDYINAHGTSTQANDSAETASIKKVFGEYAYKVPISSTKSMTGHLLGAAGAIEAIASIGAILHDTIPPTIGYKEPDPECDLDYSTTIGRKKNINYVLSDSLGFGGHNTAIVFKKWG